MQRKTICILGRQPAIGMAELESLFGADKVEPVGNHGSLLDLEPADLPFQRLGGTVKACKLLVTLPFTDWQKIIDHLVEHVPKHTGHTGSGKLTIGISAYGFKISPKAVSAASLSVKKALKNTGRSARVVPNKSAELSSAQVLHNKMAGTALGMELVLIKHKSTAVLGQTFAVQDFEAYAARDQKRPKRDARVGMLPPKLAQIVINLAVDGLASHSKRLTVLDPFCGTGVILQEALLMGYKVFGTDLDQRMVEYSKENLGWLLAQPRPLPSVSHPTPPAPQLEVADAIDHTWNPAPDFIAAETYLGRPFSAPPKPATLNEVIRDVDAIHRKFLKNLAGQTKPGLKLCLAVPAWATRTKTGPQSPYTNFTRLPLLASLRQLGYTRQSFVHTADRDLVYYRPGQVVGRELVVLKRL